MLLCANVADNAETMGDSIGRGADYTSEDALDRPSLMLPYLRVRITHSCPPKAAYVLIPSVFLCFAVIWII